MAAKTRRRSVTSVITIGTLGVVTLAGCSVGSARPSESPAGDSVEIALFSDPQGAVVPLVYGVDNYGDDFDLDISVAQNVTTFDSHKPLVETSRADDIQVMATSVSAILDAREQGEDLKIFCPYVGVDDFVLAGANGVNTVAQLFEPSTRVGIDSPGGAGAIVLNALLSGVGETRDIPDLPNPQIIESSGDRTAEWGAGNLDATVIHEAQYDAVETQVDRPVRIATLYENAPDFVKAAQAADADWLDENRELAARYCATTLRAMTELKGDFALFDAAVNTYVETPPSADGMRDLFELINQYPFWTEDGGLSETSIQYMIDLSVESGVLAEPLDAAEVVDRATLDRAVELANSPAG
jgi:NitT/TauT family transport system substrate-binding protein